MSNIFKSGYLGGHIRPCTVLIKKKIAYLDKKLNNQNIKVIANWIPLNTIREFNYKFIHVDNIMWNSFVYTVIQNLCN